MNSDLFFYFFEKNGQLRETVSSFSEKLINVFLFIFLFPIRTLFLKILITVHFIILGYYLRKIVFPPRNFPKNIPTVPFYLTFLPLFCKLDQKDIYENYLRKKLEKYGAVKFFFGSKWNIMVSRPEFLNEIFKHEEIYMKKGNQEKIPHSVIALYLGKNVISSRGDDWKRYRDLVKKSIQFPDFDAVNNNVKRFFSFLEKKLDKNRSVLISNILQRYALENIGNSVIGCDFGTFDSENPHFIESLTLIKKKIFNFFFLNFPYLDSFAIPLRIMARKEILDFRNNFIKKLSVDPSTMPDGSLLKSLTNALNDGILSKKEFIDNLMVVMVAGHENPLLMLSSVIYLLAKHPQEQKKLRSFLISDPDTPYLNAVIYESLRLYPPLSIIINRCTSRSVLLGNSIPIPKNTFVGYINLATGRDPNYWSPDPDSFIPERWGSENLEIFKNYSNAKKLSSFPVFHGGKRSCLGEKFALNSAKILIKSILLKYDLSLDPKWPDRITRSGPVGPENLKIIFNNL